MKNNIMIMALLCLFCVSGMAQADKPETAKKSQRKNLVIKEWNTINGTSTRFLDHVTKYDADGRKIEDVEYSQKGMKARCTYEYDVNGRVSKEVVYNDQNKPVRIRKFEYYSDGSKKKQYNYSPKGKLESTKEFEYIFK